YALATHCAHPIFDRIRGRHADHGGTVCEHDDRHDDLSDLLDRHRRREDREPGRPIPDNREQRRPAGSHELHVLLAVERWQLDPVDSVVDAVSLSHEGPAALRTLFPFLSFSGIALPIRPFSSYPFHLRTI